MAMRKIARRKLFAAFLGLGTLCGLLLGGLSSTSAMAKAHADTSQRNLLVVLVEDASAESTPLLGTWLAASSIQSGEINWVPLYPTPLESEGPYSAGHDPVWVSPADLTGLEGAKPMRSAGIWWDQVVVLDRSALDSLLALTGGEATAADPIESWAEPQRALHQQVTAIQSLCADDALLHSQAALDTALALLGEHAHASLTAFEIIALWDRLQGQDSSLICRHPWAD